MTTQQPVITAIKKVLDKGDIECPLLLSGYVKFLVYLASSPSFFTTSRDEEVPARRKKASFMLIS
jgi:hypothetical protein